MSTFAQTSERDFSLVEGQLVLQTDVAQAAATELQNKFLFGKGEYFLDTREGIPFFEQIFVKNPDTLAIRELLRNVILSTQGIKSVLSLDVTFDSSKRQASYTFSALTDTGAIISGGSGQPFIVGS